MTSLTSRKSGTSWLDFKRHHGLQCRTTSAGRLSNTRPPAPACLPPTPSTPPLSTAAAASSSPPTRAAAAYTKTSKRAHNNDNCSFEFSRGTVSIALYWPYATQSIPPWSSNKQSSQFLCAELDDVFVSTWSLTMPSWKASSARRPPDFYGHQ